LDILPLTVVVKWFSYCPVTGDKCVAPV